MIQDKKRNKYDLILPDPSATFESLGNIGYSLPTAIADLIDNSISAKAKNVWIEFEWKRDERSFVVIKDDGEGMTDGELMEAMRVGSKNPTEERSASDLGRFGMGLKTASLSQCRRLSVVSRRIGSGQLVSRCWDQDYINKTKEWRLLKNIDPDPLELSGQSLEGQGTVILWENIDRITGGKSHSDDNKAHERFDAAIKKVEKHLEMVFHRYIENPSGPKLWINHNKIDSWDPFLTNEKATQELTREKLTCGDKVFTVRPYVLPHHSKISPEVHKKAGGPRGWNAQQGFYVYRNKRLIVSGNWLDLGFYKEEHYKLARIQIDIPNSMDREWAINVDKSKAKIPDYLRRNLRGIARKTRNQASQIYRHRGKTTGRRTAKEDEFMWLSKEKHNKYFFRINREHSFIKQIKKSDSDGKIEPLLKMIEAAIPTSTIMILHSEHPGKMAGPFDNWTSEQILRMLREVFSVYTKTGLTKDEAISKLNTSEPFNQFPESIGVLKEELSKSNG